MIFLGIVYFSSMYKKIEKMMRFNKIQQSINYYDTMIVKHNW